MPTFLSAAGYKLIIEQFEHVLKENAIDCTLFHARNEFKTDDKKIKCNS